MNTDHYAMGSLIAPVQGFGSAGVTGQGPMGRRKSNVFCKQRAQDENARRGHYDPQNRGRNEFGS
jgi:hypothetical protein